MSQTKDKPLILEEFLPYQLSILTNKISQKLADYYSSEFNLSIPEWRVMAILGQSEGLSAVDIAARTAMDKVAVSRAITRLLENDLISRQFLQEDKRCSRVNLTKAGKTIYQKIVPVALAYQTGLTAVLSQQETIHLQSIIDKLTQQIVTLDFI